MDSQLIKQLLSLFPEDFEFDPPVKGPRSTRDDGRLVRDLRKQTATSKRALTDRQSAALIRTVAKYASRNPAMLAAAERLGLGEFLREQINAYQLASQKQNSSVSTGQTLSPAFMKLLEEMKGITWEKPVASGRRKPFDAGRFFRSILRQAETNHALTPRQMAAIGNMASRSADQIPSYAELAKELNLPPAGTDGATAQEDIAADDADKQPEAAPGSGINADLAKVCEELFRRAAAITDWHPATKRGRRVYDDKAFTDSLQEQFQRKGMLSEKQIAALQKLLSHYEK